MTPICAHSLHSRPVVYSDDSVLEIVQVNGNTPLNIIIDGKIVNVITDNEIIKIKKSEFYTEFITRGNKNFFNKLLIKLNIWSK